MSPHKDIVGVILAGGKSRRMGTAKALLKLRGVPLIQHVAALMAKTFSSVVIIADNGAEYAFLNLPTYPDVKKNCGPLGGIHSAFVNTDAEKIFVVSCDEPFISKDLVEYVCEFGAQTEIKVPSIRGNVEPLCGLYSRTILPAVEKAISLNDLKVKHLLLQCHTTTIPISPALPFYKEHLFANLNEPSDFESALGQH